MGSKLQKSGNTQVEADLFVFRTVLICETEFTSDVSRKPIDLVFFIESFDRCKINEDPVAGLTVKHLAIHKKLVQYICT